MEKAYKFLKENSIQASTDDYFHFENDIKKLMDIGLVFRKNGWYKINPLIESKKSVTEARNALKKKVQGWMDTMQHIDDAQERFRYDMVDFFKNNPIEENVMSIDTPEQYRNTSGYCYILNNKIISLHAGYKPPKNAPEGCDRFKYKALVGYIEVQY